MRFHDGKPNSRSGSREVTKFLWFPKKINQVTRWLETASWLETAFRDSIGNGWHWKASCWLDWEASE